MPPANKRRSPAKDTEPSDETRSEEAAAAEETRAESPAATDHPPAPPAQDPILPGASAGDELPGDEGDGEADDGGALADDSGAAMPKDVLIGMSEAILPGFDPIVVRGVLADAPDPISAADAKTRVERFLAAPVTTTQEA